MDTHKINPKPYPDDYPLHFQDNLYDAMPTPSVQETIKIRKRMRETLRDDEIDTHLKKAKTNITNTNDNTWPIFIPIESKQTEGDTLNKLAPFAVSKYIEHCIRNVAAVKHYVQVACWSKQPAENTPKKL